MLQSDGRLILADSSPQFAFQTYQPTNGLSLIAAFSSYGQIYRKQQWVYTVVRKRALAVRRLPFKVYQRSDQGRIEQPDSPLADLLRAPNWYMSGPDLWEWTSSTKDVYGEAIWMKLRDDRGLVRQLIPVHPTNVVVRRNDQGELEYLYGPGLLVASTAQLVIPQRDIVHFRSYNPDTVIRGMSPLEPLRQSLANDDAARRASSAFWTNGGRPSGYLSHPGKLSDDALNRLRAQWNETHGGVDNFGKFAILEEGMKPEVLSLSAEEAQYIESRKLNREEVCGVYDMPPPVVHILDKATFSNIVEQMRSLYRDTMAPILGGFEDTLLDQLIVPDFRGDEYAEFLMDEVLRGDFEQRMSAYVSAVNNAIFTPNEIREMENKGHLDGGEKLYINSALIPIESAAVPPASSDVVSRSIMGRLGQVTELGEVDIKSISAALGDRGPAVEDLFDRVLLNGGTVDEFRRDLRDLLAAKELTP